MIAVRIARLIIGVVPIKSTTPQKIKGRESTTPNTADRKPFLGDDMKEKPIVFKSNNRKFQEFMDRFAADTVSIKVRSLMWECWVAAIESVGGEGNLSSNTASPKCQHSFFSSTEFGFVECKYCGETYPIEAQRI